MNEDITDLTATGLLAAWRIFSIECKCESVAAFNSMIQDAAVILDDRNKRLNELENK